MTICTTCQQPMICETYGAADEYWSEYCLSPDCDDPQFNHGGPEIDEPKSKYAKLFDDTCRLIKPPSPKASAVLKSYRTARVLGNELHLMKYDDPSHGWLAVPRCWVIALGIESFTSSWSYQRGQFVYLEEDDDAARFRIAAEHFGYKLFVSVRHTDKRSPIRSLDCFGLRENELGE
jgi:hypothetical protein